MPEWVTQKHPKFKKSKERNKFVMDLYTGKAKDIALKEAKKIAKNYYRTLNRSDDDITVKKPEDRLGKYLYRKMRGEHPENFWERARISKFPDHFSQIVDRQVGAVELAGYKTNRWTREGEGPLGDPNNRDSTVSRLMENSDGKETNYSTKIAEGIKKMYLKDRLWYLVDGPTGDSDLPRIVYLDSVINWYEENGRLTDVIAVESRDARTSIRDEHKKERIYIHYNLEGYRRFDSDGNPLQERQMWDNPFYETSQRQKRILPIGKIDLKMNRDVPKEMAKGQEYLYNQLSDLRMALRISSFPKMSVSASDSAWEDTRKALQRGSNLVRADSASWMSLPMSGIKQGYEIYKSDVQEYYKESFEQLNDTARESTATEIRLEDQRGRQAFLIHLARRAEEFENHIRFRLAQIVSPNSPEMWHIPKVERSNDFQPMNPANEAQVLREVFWPDGVGGEARKEEAASKISDLLGLNVDVEMERTDSVEGSGNEMENNEEE